MYSKSDIFMYLSRRHVHKINSKGNNEIPQSTEKYKKGL